MNAHEIEALIAEAVRDADLHPEEIPSIDLYLDQITSLVAEKHRQGSAQFEDRALTKTMINNYSKDGLLSPIKGKKYSKEHILQMLLVYELKSTLSIGEIKRILQNVYNLPNYSPALLEHIYVRFLSVKEMERNEAWPAINTFLERNGLDVENEDDLFTLILGLCAMSAYLKNIAQLLLQTHYPDLNVEKTREEQEKKEEAKRIKAEQKAGKKASREKDAKEKPKKEKTTKDKRSNGGEGETE